MEYNKKQEKASKRQGKQLKLAYHVLKKQCVPNSACAYGLKRLIPAKATLPKSQVAVQQHKQQVLEEKTPEDRIKVTKRKADKRINEGAENMMRRCKALGVQDRLKQWISRRMRN
ncbi:hypothetical protein Tco_1581765, partial [Tanacetum coccineum]